MHGGAFRPNLKAQAEGLASHAGVIDKDRVRDRSNGGWLFVPAGDFDFFLLGSVVVQSPQRIASGIVAAADAELREKTIIIYFHPGAFVIAPVFEHETADVVIQGFILRKGRGGKLGEGVRAAVEGDGAFAHKACLAIPFHILAHAVLERRNVRRIENEPAVAVRAFHARLHLVCDSAVLEFQLHSQTIFLDGRNGLVEGVALTGLQVPIPVGLHPGLVYSYLFPVFVAGSHVVRHPVEFLAGGVAALGKRGHYLLPILITAVDVYVVRQVKLFGGDVEAVQFKVFGGQSLETRADLAHIPVKGLEPVLYAGEVKSVAPIGCGRFLVGEVLEHHGVRKADYHFAFCWRVTYSGGRIGAGFVQGSHSAILAQP